MSEPIRILHGQFGRAALLQLDRSMALHAHRECHIVLKVGGPDILFGIGAQEHPVTSRNALLINAWEPHFYHHRGTGTSTLLLALYLNSHWLKEVDRRFSRSTHPKFFTRSVVSMTSRLEQLQHDVLDLLLQQSAPSRDILEQWIARIFEEITVLTTPPDRAFPLGINGELGFDARIRHAIEHLLFNSLGSLDVQELNSSTGLSRAHFFRLFRSSTGLTPVAFMNMLRLEASVAHVSRRDAPLQDVATLLGFDSAANFARFFSAQQGVAPSKYRKVVEFMDTGQQQPA
ncbi:AraC family transcriptional regulator [Roseateles sp.]|uniref:AraC family transcriptional regulator n=1 Tax=Roseateles sp. TaxID=1971397 RepID=UPI0039EA9E4F